MWRVERKYPHSSSFIYLILKICRGTDENHWSLPGLYATPYASPFLALLLFFTPQHPAYGNYNDLVLEASGIRGQSVVIWDFEYVLPPRCKCQANDCFNSSGDSGGASVATSKNLYDQIISRHPSTILPLNHETIGTYIFQ